MAFLTHGLHRLRICPTLNEADAPCSTSLVHSHSVKHTSNRSPHLVQSATNRNRIDATRGTCRRNSPAALVFRQLFNVTSDIIASISGHASLAEVTRYTKAADQVRMAQDGMAMLVIEAKRRTKVSNQSVRIDKNEE